MDPRQVRGTGTPWFNHAFAPLPTRLFSNTTREPDLLYISPENAPAPDVEYPSHLDVALEIASTGQQARQRDYEDKRIDYARAEILEYWIVDPQENQVTVLVLRNGAYVEHGVFELVTWPWESCFRTS